MREPSDSRPGATSAVADHFRLSYSDSESKRFGFRVFRGTWPVIEPGELLEAVLAAQADMVFLRVSTERFEPAGLAQTGLPHLVADTLVYYHCDLSHYEPQLLRNSDLEFLVAGAEHAAVLSGLVDSCFADYTNHYAANPLLRREDWLTGYKEWALGYARPDDDRCCFLAKRADEIVAFATCSFDETSCEGVLYGVAPGAAGGGLYGDLIRFTQRYFKERGRTLMKVSTQIQNVAVQKVWTREGFRLAESFATLHVNSFIAHAVQPPSTIAFRPDPDEPLASTLQTMAAQHARAYPEQRLSHVTGRQLSVVEPGLDYMLTCTAFASDADGTPRQTLTKVTDPAGRVCFLGYGRLDA